MEAQRKGLFYPEDYGIIVESGTGEPDAAIKQKMTQEYGFNHEAMIDIPGPQKAGAMTQSLASTAVNASSREAQDDTGENN